MEENKELGDVEDEEEEEEDADDEEEDAVDDELVDSWGKLPFIILELLLLFVGLVLILVEDEGGDKLMLFKFKSINLLLVTDELVLLPLILDVPGGDGCCMPFCCKDGVRLGEGLGIPFGVVALVAETEGGGGGVCGIGVCVAERGVCAFIMMPDDEDAPVPANAVVGLGVDDRVLFEIIDDCT